MVHGWALLPGGSEDPDGNLTGAGPTATFAPKGGGQATTLHCDTTTASMNNVRTLTFAVAPEVTPGSYTFTLTGSTSSQDVTIVPPVPKITKVDPHDGPEAGNAAITISGVALDQVAKVTVGDATAPISAKTAAQITVTTPPGTGAVEVSGFLADKTKVPAQDNAYKYAKKPVVTSLNPSQGNNADPTFVTITGTDFDSASSVTFNGTEVHFGQSRALRSLRSHRRAHQVRCTCR